MCLNLAGLVGVDPTDRTYRELQHMADGHQRAAWGHTLALALAVRKAITGEGPNLLDLVPEQYRDDEPLATPATEEEQDAAAALAFAGLESGLKAMQQQWRE